MLVKEVFKVSAGRRIETAYKDSMAAFVLSTTCLDKCVINTSSNTTSVDPNIDPKYFLHKDDIVISTTFTENKVHVGYASSIPEYPVVIGKNLIILRSANVNIDPLFIAEYIDKIALPNYIKNRADNPDKPKSDRLSLSEIEELSIPDIDKDEQEKLSQLFKKINKRTDYYNKIIDNNNRIKLALLEKVKIDEDDR